ncbi:deoxyribodipyrimidine photo-lyase [Gracilinema caldarium]|uniref:deoxyribodipyrimidine photo-lyase n=1 Tax=Gracilinema caldarium TaxID=215591 RepID=UPI0026F05104|nr:deoxyribodipyrimidine photo-lyase [Gracilinema caldarium]
MQVQRIHECNSRDEQRGSFVLYWMQASVRGQGNLALDWAVEVANRKKLPLIAVFCLQDRYLSASVLHYKHLLTGLAEAQQVLADKGIRLYIFQGSPLDIIPRLAQHAALAVLDTGYLRHQRTWRKTLGELLPCRTVWIESNVVIPVETASVKEEWSAYTLRRKITPLLDDFLDVSTEAVPVLTSLNFDLALEVVPLQAVELGSLFVNIPGTRPRRLKGQQIAEPAGHSAAMERFMDFIRTKLDSYETGRNNPLAEGTSRMSAALHFGFVSPLELVLALQQELELPRISSCDHPGAAAYLEELIVRRELGINFCYYNDYYDSPLGLPDWAVKTLSEGNLHPREHLYSLENLEDAKTEDPYWNAAQNQMVKTGYMHGYMRMYWGKRLLSWVGDFETAMKFAIFLNDQYSLDGRDPNGYAGIAWCFGKHDRPWSGRPIYGTVRYMNAAGLRRKFDADTYATLYK